MDQSMVQLVQSWTEMLSIPFQSIHVVRVYSAILNEDCHVEMDRLILGTLAINSLSILIKYYNYIFLEILKVATKTQYLTGQHKDTMKIKVYGLCALQWKKNIYQYCVLI